MQTLHRLARAADIDPRHALEDALGLLALCAMIVAGFAVSSFF